MRPIEKGPPPPCLAELKGELRRVERESGQRPKPDDWAPGSCAQSIRDALHRDQHGLCGYCMQSIAPHGHRDKPKDNRGMRIEHLITRRAESRRMYDWPNLIGVCGGRSGAPGGAVYDHCDRARNDAPLTLSPIAPSPVETSIRFSRQAPADVDDDGDSVWIHAPAELQADLEILNLNNPALRRRRRDAEGQIARQLAALVKRRKSPLAYLRRLVETAATPEPGGTLPAFAPVVQQYAERKLREHGAKR